MDDQLQAILLPRARGYQLSQACLRHLFPIEEEVFEALPVHVMEKINNNMHIIGRYCNMHENLAQRNQIHHIGPCISQH